ncbi:hypothetical protein CC2G_004423 [Coprinopsis cinerea AmutBmut pab1-1]|nr:hypothetical protein CC2G_004423 [Coprinopsis cinerea AmutBmut pab1-1]
MHLPASTTTIFPCACHATSSSDEALRCSASLVGKRVDVTYFASNQNLAPSESWASLQLLIDNRVKLLGRSKRKSQCLWYLVRAGPSARSRRFKAVFLFLDQSFNLQLILVFRITLIATLELSAQLVRLVVIVPKVVPRWIKHRQMEFPMQGFWGGRSTFGSTPSGSGVCGITNMGCKATRLHLGPTSWTGVRHWEDGRMNLRGPWLCHGDRQGPWDSCLLEITNKL